VTGDRKRRVVRAADVAAIERCSLRAWPAREEAALGGWVLRFSDGYTRRANSVNPIGPIRLDVREAIGICEKMYAARGLPPVFKLTPESVPPALDAELAGAGYVREAPTRVQTRSLGAELAAAPDAALELRPELEERWLAIFSRWLDVPDARRLAHASILRAIAPRRAFAILHAGSCPVAAGLAVADPPLLGLFDLVTAPEARRRGFGERLVRGLLAWGLREGCENAYLQVMDANETARRLYERLGFEDAYPYWYRVPPR
jgi:GNAT superfamily N-acetyltransferase